jgi:hypothetical protein
MFTPHLRAAWGLSGPGAALRTRDFRHLRFCRALSLPTGNHHIAMFSELWGE